MIDIEDIKKITEYQIEVFKDVFLTKEDGKKFEARFDRIQNSLDAVLKDKQGKDQEMIILNYRVKKAEDLLDQVAPKLGLKYEH